MNVTLDAQFICYNFLEEKKNLKNTGHESIALRRRKKDISKKKVFRL
jgi:hypothetical protein